MLLVPGSPGQRLPRTLKAGPTLREDQQLLIRKEVIIKAIIARVLPYVITRHPCRCHLAATREPHAGGLEELRVTEKVTKEAQEANGGEWRNVQMISESFLCVLSSEFLLSFGLVASIVMALITRLSCAKVSKSLTLYWWSTAQTSSAELHCKTPHVYGLISFFNVSPAKNFFRFSAIKSSAPCGLPPAA